MNFPDWIPEKLAPIICKEWELLGLSIDLLRGAALVKQDDELRAAYFAEIGPNGMRLRGWKKMTEKDFSYFVTETNQDLTLKEAFLLLGENIKFKLVKNKTDGLYTLGA